MFILKIAALFMFLARVAGWSSDSDSRTDEYSDYYSDDEYSDSSDVSPYSQRPQDSKFSGCPGLNPDARIPDGMKVGDILTNLNQLVCWFRKATSDQIWLRREELRMAFATERTGRFLTGAEVNYAYFFEYFASGKSVENAHGYEELLLTPSSGIQSLLRRGLLSKLEERLEQLRHDIPIYMETWGFADYWQEVGRNIAERKERAAAAKQWRRERKAIQMGGQAKLGDLAVVTSSAMENPEMISKTRKRFMLRSPEDRVVTVIQDQDPTAHDWSIRALAFATAIGSTELVIIPNYDSVSSSRGSRFLYPQDSQNTTAQIPTISAESFFLSMIDAQREAAPWFGIPDRLRHVLRVALLTQQAGITYISRDEDSPPYDDEDSPPYDITEWLNPVPWIQNSLPQTVKVVGTKLLIGLTVSPNGEEMEEAFKRLSDAITTDMSTLTNIDAIYLLASGAYQPIRSSVESFHEAVIQTYPEKKIATTVITTVPKEPINAEMAQRRETTARDNVVGYLRGWTDKRDPIHLLRRIILHGEVSSAFICPLT
ncbi:MAG: hypothetical protein LBF65_00330 [Holosporales bacterium]|jgi:hypothetical protein|nr:hypothetical protein [Holosporales bacterium]